MRRNQCSRYNRIGRSFCNCMFYFFFNLKHREIKLIVLSSLQISKRNLLAVEPSKRLKVVEKVAMLIGNADEVLKKPINDIVKLAQKLKSVGFKVISLINLSAEDMLKALEIFSDLIEEDVYG